jgi:hypothetical protein
MADDLAHWLDIRRAVAWSEAGDGLDRPMAAGRDGFTAFVDTVILPADPARARRLHRALALVRADVGQPLSVALLLRWQRVVLGSAVDLRTQDAYAKRGRERYGREFMSAEHLDSCLAESRQDGVPLAGRAARAYLDVAFFHPFKDGVGRSAMLVLCHLLASAGVVLDQVAPALMTARAARDPQSAFELARLLHVLGLAARRRRRSPPPTCRLGGAEAGVGSARHVNGHRIPDGPADLLDMKSPDGGVPRPNDIDSERIAADWNS